MAQVTSQYMLIWVRSTSSTLVRWLWVPMLFNKSWLYKQNIQFFSLMLIFHPRFFAWICVFYLSLSIYLCVSPLMCAEHSLFLVSYLMGKTIEGNFVICVGGMGEIAMLNILQKTFKCFRSNYAQMSRNLVPKVT